MPIPPRTLPPHAAELLRDAVDRVFVDRARGVKEDPKEAQALVRKHKQALYKARARLAELEGQIVATKAKVRFLVGEIDKAQIKGKGEARPDSQALLGSVLDRLRQR